MGTFGGPDSSNFPLFAGTINSHGVTIGWSATSTPTTPTSHPFICGGTDGIGTFITHFESHGFAWQKGVVVDLGSLAGPNFCSAAFWVNDKDEVVGASEIAEVDPLFFGFNQARAVLWKHGEIIDLGTLGGNQVFASGINNRGQVVGTATNTIPDPYCFFATTQIRTFLWQNGQMQDLGTLGGNCATTGLIDVAGNPINERGQIVGGSSTSSVPNPITGVPPFDPFLWEEGKGMTDLGTLGGAFGGAQGVNNRGQVIGQSSIASDPGACNGFPDNGNNNCHPFLWDKGTLIDLNTSSIGGNPNSVAWINDAGEIVGTGAFPNAPSDAYLWKKGVATDLGHLGDCYSSALSVNSHSQVAGVTVSCDGSVFRAFLWEHGSMVDLNTLIPPGSRLQPVGASEINDRGEISGNGVPPGVPLANWVTQGHSLLLIPCDNNHLNVEGCDYSMVDANTDATAVTPSPATKVPSPFIQGNPAFGGAANPMLRRFGRRLGPWYRQLVPSARKEE
jgi:probable HAF family extracellular repeat protein